MITIANLIANFFIFSLALLMFTIATFLIYIVLSEWIGNGKWKKRWQLASDVFLFFKKHLEANIMVYNFVTHKG